MCVKSVSDVGQDGGEGSNVMMITCTAPVNTSSIEDEYDDDDAGDDDADIVDDDNEGDNHEPRETSWPA